MRNLLDDGVRQRVLERVAQLTPDGQRRWGTMDVGQMICHIADPLRIALGELPAKDASSVFTRTVLRWLVLAGMPAPKGKVKTFPELDYAKGGGTPPKQLAADVESLHGAIARFLERAASGQSFERSPAFGRLSPRAYGRLMYVHMHHHLKQFGV
jgi:hypothetical protein